MFINFPPLICAQWITIMINGLKVILWAGDNTLWTHVLQELHREKSGSQSPLSTLQTTTAGGTTETHTVTIINYMSVLYIILTLYFKNALVRYKVAIVLFYFISLYFTIKCFMFFTYRMTCIKSDLILLIQVNHIMFS